MTDKSYKIYEILAKVYNIEAMKMENEIFAPCDGTVTSVSVTEGTAVSTGDELCVIQ